MTLPTLTKCNRPLKGVSLSTDAVIDRKRPQVRTRFIPLQRAQLDRLVYSLQEDLQQLKSSACVTVSNGRSLVIHDRDPSYPHALYQ